MLISLLEVIKCFEKDERGKVNCFQADSYHFDIGCYSWVHVTKTYKTGVF